MRRKNCGPFFSNIFILISITSQAWFLKSAGLKQGSDYSIAAEITQRGIFIWQFLNFVLPGHFFLETGKGGMSLPIERQNIRFFYPWKLPSQNLMKIKAIYSIRIKQPKDFLFVMDAFWTMRATSTAFLSPIRASLRMASL